VNLLDREPVALFGFLGAAPVAIAFATRHPDRVSALVLANALAGTDPTQLPVISALYSLGEGDRKLYLETLARTMVGTSSPELVSSYAARLEEHFKPEIFREYNRMRLEGRVALDVTDALAHVACPTLVLHRRDFPNIPVSQGRELASRIADARLVVLEGDAGLPWAGDGDAALDAINSFLREGSGEQAGDPFDRALQTILFTDLESSTALTQRVGDEAAQEVLRGHNTAVRAALEEHGGREVKHTGDGIMASFPSAVAAVTAALQMQRDLAGGEVRVRIGLNAGEPIAEDDDLFGLSVILASRITDRAEPGQVLVSNVVRELCAGKTFEFTSLGEATLKGFDEPVTLYEVWA
jgi:class 3 adenylate cyclase